MRPSFSLLALVLSLGLLAGCGATVVVEDRHGPPPPAQVEEPFFEPEVTVDAEPPPPRDDWQPEGREHWIWVRGHWFWRDGFVWRRGYWLRRHWERGEWEQPAWHERDGRWHFRPGHWREREAEAAPPPREDHEEVVLEDDSPEVEVAVRDEPPRPREEFVPAPRPGYVWVHGHWTWNHGWVWRRGYWVRRQHEDDVWVDAHWSFSDGQWHFIPGRWRVEERREEPRPVPPPEHATVVVEEPRAEERPVVEAEVVVREHPPAPRMEPVPAPRRDAVWVHGHWYWNHGWEWRSGYWVRRHSEHDVWVDAHWELVDGSWHFRAGYWR